jgi:hypothetical protein
MAASQTPLSGWDGALFHQVRVTLAVLLAEPVLLLPLVVPLLLPLLHAAIVSAAVAAMAATVSFLEPRMGCHLLMMPGLRIDAGRGRRNPERHLSQPWKPKVSGNTFDVSPS